MPNLKEVKTRINSVISTQQITKAMKMVAAAKLRKAQDRIVQMRPYAEKMGVLLQNVTSSLSDGDGSIFSKNKGLDRILIIIITSDRGLCGAFNSNITKAASNRIHNEYQLQYEAGDVSVLPLGKKGLDYFRKRGYNVIDEFSDVFHDLTTENVFKIANFIMKSFQKDEFTKVELIYNEFKNVATQIIRSGSFLPVELNSEEETSVSETDYIFEPSLELIVEDLIPKSLKIQLYRGILESNASEQGARMTAMGQATENAGELLDQLRLTYNRTRQAVITKEISEIVGGAEALSG